MCKHAEYLNAECVCVLSMSVCVCIFSVCVFVCVGGIPEGSVVTVSRGLSRALCLFDAI